ncbi:MAG: 2'-5' RNA ligase family protein [Oscillospiraceae bacterium]|jgi:2'-5' RNA ligase|nr:2'-5' RNA ligase family protein [Oscillospiraceae bacterium]
MEYALSLYFDEVSEQRLQALNETAARATDNDYMVNIPPHITIAMFTTDNIQPIAAMMNKSLGGFNSGRVLFSSVGAFPPHTLFLAPAANPYLQSMCRMASTLLARKVSLHHLYLPNFWVPHMTSAMKLTGAELIRGFAALSDAFAQFEANVTRIAVSACEPYEDLIVLDLPAA